MTTILAPTIFISTTTVFYLPRAQGFIDEPSLVTLIHVDGTYNVLVLQ